MIRAYIGAAFIILGAVAFVLSLVGVFRFKYVLNRMHASAIADTLGTLCICIGLFVIRGFCLTSVKLIIIILAMWITGPVCTNRIAAAELATSDEYKKHLKEEE